MGKRPRLKPLGKVRSFEQLEKVLAQQWEARQAVEDSSRERQSRSLCHSSAMALDGSELVSGELENQPASPNT